MHRRAAGGGRLHLRRRRSRPGASNVGGVGNLKGAHVMNAPVTLPSKAEAIHDRAWWASECERLGTDWRSLGQVIAHLVTHLARCPRCERKPCQTPSFCEQCRQQDHERTAAMSNDQFDNT